MHKYHFNRMDYPSIILSTAFCHQCHGIFSIVLPICCRALAFLDLLLCRNLLLKLEFFWILSYCLTGLLHRKVEQQLTYFANIRFRSIKPWVLFPFLWGCDWWLFCTIWVNFIYAKFWFRLVNFLSDYLFPNLNSAFYIYNIMNHHSWKDLYRGSKYESFLLIWFRPPFSALLVVWSSYR